MEENKNNNNNKILIGIIIALVVIIVLMAGAGVYYFASKYTNKQEANTEESNIDNTEKEDVDNNSNSSVEATSSEGATASTVENPLKLGEWGLASKYVSKNLSEVYADKNYTDVPVRVTKVTRGEEAKKIVQDWFNNQTLYKYEDPKSYTEWAVIDYQVDLSKLTFDEGTIGTSVDISSDVKGLTGNAVKYNDITYILSTKDITNRDYVKEPGVYDCKFIVTLPQGCTDYLVKLGSSYNGAESYFKCE